MSEIPETHHEATHQGVFRERAFWVRVWGHMKTDLSSIVLAVRNVGGVILATFLGVSLFLLEFESVKEFVVYILVIPAAIYWTVEHLTILPTFLAFFFIFFISPKYAAISLSVISVFSFIWVLLM